MEKWLRSYSRGEYIALQGEKAHTFGVLHHGYVGVYKDNQRIATLHEPGAFVGEMAWLLNGVRTASIRAETNGVEIYLIPTKGFASVANGNPMLTLRLAQTLARRLKRVTEDLSAERLAVPGEARLSGAEPATARLINLIRTACELKPDDDVLKVLLMHVLRTTGPANPGVEPSHEAVRDLAEVAYEDGRVIDVAAILERVKNNVFTPQTRPKEADALNASIAPGSAQSAAARALRPDAAGAAKLPDLPSADDPE